MEGCSTPPMKRRPGLHELVASVVDGGGGVVHRTDKGELVGMPGHAGKVLGDLDAGDVGFDGLVGAADFDGGVGLHVPGVELGGASDEHEEDDVDVGFVGVDGAGGFEAEPLRQAEAKRGERAGVKEITAAEAVAEFDGFIGVQTEHGLPPRGAWFILPLILVQHSGGG
jgi:hypothetical protein